VGQQHFGGETVRRKRTGDILDRPKIRHKRPFPYAKFPREDQLDIVYKKFKNAMNHPGHITEEIWFKGIIGELIDELQKDIGWSQLMSKDGIIEQLESRVRELEADEEFHICKNNEYMERIENLEAENEQRKQDFEGTCQELNQVKAERDRLKAENEGLKGEILLSTVPLHEHQELRARHAALVEAAGRTVLNNPHTTGELKAALAKVK
jgi:hypothetical protein